MEFVSTTKSLPDIWQCFSYLLDNVKVAKICKIQMMRSDVFIKNPCELETIPEGAEIQLTLASPQHRINIEMNSSPSRILDQADLMPVTRSCLPKEVSDDETDTE